MTKKFPEVFKKFVNENLIWENIVINIIVINKYYSELKCVAKCLIQIFCKQLSQDKTTNNRKAMLYPSVVVAE